MPDTELYELEDVHIDELIQHVIDSKGSELVLVTEQPPALGFLVFGGEIKQIGAYENLRAPVLRRMIEDIFTDEQIRQFRSESQISGFYTTADAAARYEFDVTCNDASITAKFFLLPPTQNATV